jgi:hypothetical protein
MIIAQLLLDDLTSKAKESLRLRMTMDFDSGSGGSYLLGNNRGVMLTVSKCWKVL